MANLDKQIKFYESNIQGLLKDYEGTMIVISPDLKVDAFSTLNDAYKFGVENYGLGQFLLRECSENVINKTHFITPSIVLA